MEPKGVRMACPDCTLDVVMTSEGDCPPPVTKTVEGVPYCPNCNVPMKPVASVDTTLRERALVTPKMTLEDVARICAALEDDAEELAGEVEKAKKVYADKKKAYDAKIVTLRMAVERLGRVLGGEEIAADMPLLSIAEQPQPADTRCPSVHDHEGAAVRCIGEVGHGGVHANGDVFWDPTVVEEAVALQASEVDDEPEPSPAEDEALPLPKKRGRRERPEPVPA